MACKLCGREYGLMVLAKDGSKRHLLCRQCSGMSEYEWIQACREQERGMPLPTISVKLEAEHRVLLQSTVLFKRSRQDRISQEK